MNSDDNRKHREEVERRRRELNEKEFQNELARDLNLKYDKIRNEEIESRYRNKYVDAAIRFLSTLGISYLILLMVIFLFKEFFGKPLAILGVDLGWTDTFIHTLVWLLAVVSIFRKRSILDDIADLFY